MFTNMRGPEFRLVKVFDPSARKREKFTGVPICWKWRYGRYILPMIVFKVSVEPARVNYPSHWESTKRWQDMFPFRE